MAHDDRDVAGTLQVAAAAMVIRRGFQSDRSYGRRCRVAMEMSEIALWREATHERVVNPGSRLREAPRRDLGRRMLTLSRLAACLVISVGVAVASGEERVPSIGPMTFHIPSQPLMDALQAYSRQTGVQVMFETASATGFQSEPVEGEFTPEAALRTLLADTDLKVRYSRASAVTLAPASAASPDDPPDHPLATTADLALTTLHVSGGEAADRGRLGEYIGAVQSDIQKALKKLGLTPHTDYRVAVRLWVTPARTIERAEIDSPTGDHDRDSAIAVALRGLTLSQQAPPNTPQPIRFMISIRGL